MIVRERPICRLWQGYEIICERKKGRLFKEMEDSILKKARADRLDSPSQKKPDFLFSSERGRWDQITMPFWEDTFKRPRLTPFKSYRICYNTRYSHCTLANSFISDKLGITKIFVKHVASIDSRNHWYMITTTILRYFYKLSKVCANFVANLVLIVPWFGSLGAQ